MRSAAASPPADSRILDMTAEHIRRFGSSRLTIVAVAEDLGMSHANVYRYFPSKAALLETITIQWLRPIESGLRGVADGPDPARDKLERFIGGLHRAYREKLETDPRIYEVLLDFFRRRAAVSRNHRGRVHTEGRRILEEGMAAGAFSYGDLNRMMHFVFDSAHRFIHPVCVADDRDAPRAEIAARLDRVMDIMLLGLSRTPRRPAI